MSQCTRVRVGCCCFFFQAEDGIRDLVRSRGLGDVYKRQVMMRRAPTLQASLTACMAFTDRLCTCDIRPTAWRLSLIHI